MTYRRFLCSKCGRDWMTTLPGVDTCQVCYHKGQRDIEHWIKLVTDASGLPRSRIRPVRKVGQEG